MRNWIIGTPLQLPSACFCFVVREVNVDRYNEALVLLGEKSERVEELQLDIVDLKEGYQHALQRLVEGK